MNKLMEYLKSKVTLRTLMTLAGLCLAAATYLETRPTHQTNTYNTYNIGEHSTVDVIINHNHDEPTP